VGREHGCSLAEQWEDGPVVGRVKERGTHALIPLLRAYTRYAPAEARRERFWREVVEPHFAWHDHEFVARTVFGSRLSGRTTEILQQHVYFFGVWEPNLTRWLSSRLARGDTFVDVGANVGYFSLLAATRVGRFGKVVAIEPSPRTFARLVDNLERNRARQVRALEVAAADEHGRALLTEGPPEHTGLATMVRDIWPDETTEVATAPLADLLEPREIQRARVIKIDVEGAEPAVLRGLAPALANTRDDLELVVEVHDGRMPEVFTALEGSGMNPYLLDVEYDPTAYAAGREPRATRLEAPLADYDNVDVVFSRHDGAVLP
jgi:FkbM family methyltransferase